LKEWASNQTVAPGITRPLHATGKDKTFLIVYCAMFSLTWSDDCSFLFPNIYFNNNSRKV